MSEVYEENIIGQVNSVSSVRGETGDTSPPFKIIFPRDSVAEFPTTGKENALYIDKSAKPNIAYRWDADEAAYIMIGGTGEGGMSDYTQLSNLPTINGVTVQGDLTSDDLGIENTGVSDVVITTADEVTEDTLLVINPDASPEKIPEWYNGALVTAAGETVVDGSAAGDYYVNTDTFDVYYATAENTWDIVGNIKGNDGAAGIYVGDSEDEANASGATVWVNPSAVADDSYVTEDYVTSALSFKGIKVSSPAAIGSTSDLQTANTEATQIYSTVEYNSDESIFSYDNTTGKITINRTGYYEFQASAAIRTLTNIAAIYGTIRIKYDKTAIGGTVGNVKSINWPMCQTNASATQGTAYPTITVIAFMEAGTVFYVTTGCVLGTWCATAGSGYSFAITYLGGNNTASEQETQTVSSGIKYKNSDGEWVDLVVPSVVDANAEVITVVLELAQKLNTITSAARDMQKPIIEIVRAADDGHLYVMQGGVSDGNNIYFYYYTKTADRTVTDFMRICKYSRASKTLLVSQSFTGTSADAGEPYYHGNDMTYNPNTGQLLVLGYYDADQTQIKIVNTETLEIEDTVTISDVGLSSVAYNSALDRYIGAVRGSCDVQVFDSDWNYIKTITMTDRLSEGYSKQGIECDENYIYIPYWISGTDRNIIDVCDWNGNLVKTWNISNITGLHEIEWLSKKDDSAFYVGACGSNNYELITVFEINTALY